MLTCDPFSNFIGRTSRNGSFKMSTRQLKVEDPAWGKPRYKLGLLAMKSGDTAGAARFMTDVVTVDPTSQEAALARTALDQLKK